MCSPYYTDINSCIHLGIYSTYCRWVQAKQGKLFCLSAKSARRLMTRASQNKVNVNYKTQNKIQNISIFLESIFVKLIITENLLSPYLGFFQFNQVFFFLLNGTMLRMYNNFLCTKNDCITPIYVKQRISQMTVMVCKLMKFQYMTVKFPLACQYRFFY